MKKIILLLLTTLMMVGCTEYEINKDGSIGVPMGDSPYQPRVRVIDSCEYIVWKGYIAHKGNCRFCKERDSIKWEKRKKELEELVIKLKEK